MKTIRVDDEVYAALSKRMPKPGQNFSTAVAELLAGRKPEIKELPNQLGIQMYWHCRRCLVERPENQAPSDWARLSVGFTKEGVQVWRERHQINVAHIHFEGQCHPANMSSHKEG